MSFHSITHGALQRPQRTLFPVHIEEGTSTEVHIHEGHIRGSPHLHGFCETFHINSSAPSPLISLVKLVGKQEAAQISIKMDFTVSRYYRRSELLYYLNFHLCYTLSADR